MKGSWLHRRIGDRLLDRALWEADRERVGRGLAIGAFFSMMPIPLQTIPAALLAIILRTNLPSAIVACWITNPATAAFFIVLQIQIGYLALGRGSAWQALKDESIMKILAAAPLPLAVGALVCGAVLSAMAYFGGRWLMDLISLSLHRSRKG